MLALDAPTNFTRNGAEYLRTGTIKAYSATYAQSIADAPWLRVYGDPANVYGTAASGAVINYYYVNGNFLGFANGVGSWYGSTLAILASKANPITSGNNYFVYPGYGNGTYVVIPASAANTALGYTSTGTSMTAVGGTFTAFAVGAKVCFGNNSWLAVSGLNGSSGEQAYIANANPSGTWTVGTATNIGTNAINGLQYGTNFVAIGAKTSQTPLVATCATAGGTWTNQTPTNITWASIETLKSSCFDGTAHVVVSSIGRIITSTDGGVTWTDQGVVLELGSLFPLSGASSWGNALSQFILSSDGAGTVVLKTTGSGGTSNPRDPFAWSTDHGVTWNVAQVYTGKGAGATSAVRMITFAGSRWLVNNAGAIESVQDMGATIGGTPNFIGQQLSLSTGQYVRIR